VLWCLALVLSSTVLAFVLRAVLKSPVFVHDLKLPCSICRSEVFLVLKAVLKSLVFVHDVDKFSSIEASN